MILQKNDEGYEQPISFVSKALRDVELKYNIMGKWPYALVLALKSFRIYILHSKVLSCVLNIVVKEIIMQPDSDGRSRRWIAKIMEYDLKKNITKLVKGHGLARLLAYTNCKALGLNLVLHSSINNEI